MAAHIIEKNHHYDSTLLSSWPHLWQSEFKKSVKFDANCAYQLPVYNASDVNKLFGAAFGFRGTHWNSARFGWFYDSNSAEMILVAYCYDRGVRNQDTQLKFPEVARVNLGETVECSITVTDTSYVFHVTKGGITVGRIYSVSHSNISNWGYTLSLYFGGSQPAPNMMHIWLNSM